MSVSALLAITCMMFAYVDAPSMANTMLEKGVDKKESDDKKDTSDLGLEVVDQISQAAGMLLVCYKVLSSKSPCINGCQNEQLQLLMDS